MYRLFKYFFAACLLACAAFLFIDWQKNRTRRAETYLNCLSAKKFYKKMENPPAWMEKQIFDDFSSCQNATISLAALDATYKKIKTASKDKKSFFRRYRIINNKLYKHFPEDEPFSNREDAYEKALKTLTQLVALPDIDFILSDRDGMWEFSLPLDCYLTEDPLMQAPILTKAKVINTKNAILIPDHYSMSKLWAEDLKLILKTNKEIPWESKIELAFWRGGSHDKLYTMENLENIARYRICALSQEHPRLIDAGFVKTSYGQLLELFEEKKMIRPFSKLEEQIRYKYLPVLDGIICTYPGFQWRLLSNSLVMKQESNEMQWFYNALVLNWHYVSIQNNMQNLKEQVIWAKKHDSECKKIAQNATDFVLSNISFEDNYVYLYTVLSCYAKRQAFEKENLMQDIRRNKRWVCIQQRKKLNSILPH